jgi:benzoyl-CoA reductase/2-hydroxyglutaryl-CoA dehydratase subunit BcrC/BadD/HgdB
MDVKEMIKHQRKAYYTQLSEAREKGVKVAYCCAWGPTEPLYAMDIIPAFPENYAVIVSAKREVVRFLEVAERRGLSKDICSYTRAALGMMWADDGPYGPLPKPDLVISYPHLCDPYSKWWEIYAREYNVPIFHFDGPNLLRGKHTSQDLRWAVNNIEEMIKFLEEVTGRTFDRDRFKEIMALGIQARELAWQVQENKKHIPSPTGIREATNDVFYLTAFFGKQEAVDFFSKELEESNAKIAQGIGAIPEEKYRLFFYNLPPWYCLDEFIDIFSSRGAVFAMDYYCPFLWLGDYMEGFRLDPDKPVESLAISHLYRSGAIGVDIEIDRCVRAVRDWHCDGAVFNSCPGCSVHSRTLYLKMRELERQTGAVVMCYEASQSDPRTFNEGEIRREIDSFFEILEARKGK